MTSSGISVLQRITQGFLSMFYKYKSILMFKTSFQFTLKLTKSISLINEHFYLQKAISLCVSIDIKQEENKLKKHKVAFKQKLVGAGHSHLPCPHNFFIFSTCIQPRRGLGDSGSECPAQEMLSAQQDPLPDLTTIFTGIESHIQYY